MVPFPPLFSTSFAPLFPAFVFFPLILPSIHFFSFCFNSHLLLFLSAPFIFYFSLWSSFFYFSLLSSFFYFSLWFSFFYFSLWSSFFYCCPLSSISHCGPLSSFSHLKFSPLRFVSLSFLFSLLRLFSFLPSSSFYVRVPIPIVYYPHLPPFISLSSLRSISSFLSCLCGCHATPPPPPMQLCRSGGVCTSYALSGIQMGFNLNSYIF